LISQVVHESIENTYVITEKRLLATNRRQHFYTQTVTNAWN